MFVAFVCFAVASRPKYIAATCMEFVITFSLLLLYTLKLNKKLTLFFWPLVVRNLFNCSTVFTVGLSHWLTAVKMSGSQAFWVTSIVFSSSGFVQLTVCSSLHSYPESDSSVHLHSYRDPGWRGEIKTNVFLVDLLELGFWVKPHLTHPPVNNKLPKGITILVNISTNIHLYCNPTFGTQYN